MKYILKIVEYLKESGFLIKCVSETIENEVKEQKRGFIGMYLGTLGGSLWGNILAGKGVMQAGEGTTRAAQDFEFRLVF